MAAGNHFVEVLLKVSEKSAKIARAWRFQDELFELMVEEKSGKEKNERFIRDFKTLADVLVQEVVRHDVIQEFPEFNGYIFGEESNKFTNSTGQVIGIEVKENKAATARHLMSVTEGNECAAQSLADIIHTEIQLETTETQVLRDKLDFDLPLAELAIWIDPIDCTAQYMSNSPGEELNGIVVSGLPCAAVLIGVFHRETGVPVAGVINQPFSYQTKDKENNHQWKGRRLWGVAYKEHCCHNLRDSQKLSQSDNFETSSNFKIALSSNEREDIKRNLLSSGAHVFNISGVGHKLLQVIDGNVDFYVLSHSSSYKWDTCAAHAIICSLGGDVVSYNEALALKSEVMDIDKTSLLKCRLRYHTTDDMKKKKWSNTGGVIAFWSFPKLFRLLEYLC